MAKRTSRNSETGTLEETTEETPQALPPDTLEQAQHKLKTATENLAANAFNLHRTMTADGKPDYPGFIGAGESVTSAVERLKSALSNLRTVVEAEAEAKAKAEKEKVNG